MRLVLADRARAPLGGAPVSAGPWAGLAIVLVCGSAAASAGPDSPPAAAVRVESVSAEPLPPHVTFTLDSKLLGEARRINVYTPPGYAAASRRRYPVLYMPDGGVQEDFPHVTADVDSAIRSGEMRPVVVVGIENTERRRDMTGPTEVESDRTIAPRVGGAAEFRAFIRDELMPAIRARYRCDGRDAIVGESLAGLFVLETCLEEPRLFRTCIALSPSLWWNAEALTRGAEQKLRARPRGAATLVVAIASDDGSEVASARLDAALRAAPSRGLTWSIESRSDLTHATIYRGASPGILRRLFAPAARQGAGDR